METQTHIPDSLKEQMILDWEDQSLVRALMHFSYLYQGLLPVVGGGLLMAMGLLVGFAAITLKASGAILFILALLLTIAALLSLRNGLRVLTQQIPCYRGLLAGDPKTVITGQLTAVQVTGRSHLYKIGNTQTAVWIPLGKKYFKLDSYSFSRFDTVVDNVTALHFITLPGGKNILLKVIFPSFPGKEKQSALTQGERQRLKETSVRAASLTRKMVYIFLAVLFVLLSVLAKGDLPLWGGLTAVLLLTGLLLQRCIYIDTRRSEKRLKSVREKTEVAGIITQTGIIRYRITPVNSADYTLIMVGGRWYVLAFKRIFQCPEKIKFAFIRPGGRLIPVQLINGIEGPESG